MWLGIETSGRSGGAALVDDDGRVVLERMFSVEAFHSEKVLPGVAALLEETGLEGPGLSGIGVSAGPGSYTGLRIGIATAMGLSTGWGIPARGVPTLRVLSASTGSAGPVLVAVRARRGEVFAAVFGTARAASEEILPPGVYTAESVLRALEGMGVELAVGSGRSELGDVPGVRWSPEELDLPRPSIVAVLARELHSLRGPEGVIRPLYLRGFGQAAGSPGAGNAR